MFHVLAIYGLMFNSASSVDLRLNSDVHLLNLENVFIRATLGLFT